MISTLANALSRYSLLIRIPTLKPEDMHSKSCELSLVVPLYNEEKGVYQFTDDLVNTLEGSQINYELVLVNNGSWDETPRILEHLARGNQKIQVVNVEVNEGYGWGIINGLGVASGACVGFMGGDGQIKPEDVISVYEKVKTGNCDLAKVKRVKRKDGLLRLVISVLYNYLFWFMFRVQSLDINGTPKIFKKEWLEKFDLSSKDWFIDAEIMIKAKYLNLRVDETPVEFLPREAGKSHVRFSTLLEFLRNMSSYKTGRWVNEWKRKI